MIPFDNGSPSLPEPDDFESGDATSTVTTVSGILEMPNGTEGRIRQFDNGLVEGNGDPFVPVEIGQRYGLRPGQRLTVSVVERDSAPAPEPFQAMACLPVTVTA